MAYMLTLLLIAYIQSGGMNIWEAGLSLVIQLSVGAIAGFLLGRLAVLIINKIDIDNESLYPILYWLRLSSPSPLRPYVKVMAI